MLFHKPAPVYKLASGEGLFQKKPLGRRWYLMSSSAGKRGCEFSIRYVWNGAKARLRWNSPSPEAEQEQAKQEEQKHESKHEPLKYNER